jgi:hypothetical protein
MGSIDAVQPLIGTKEWWNEKSMILNIKDQPTDPALLGYKVVELDENAYWNHIDCCFPDEHPMPTPIDVEAGDEIPKDITEVIAEQCAVQEDEEEDIQPG